jgi:putative hydrolase of the HAD superfamily
MIKAIFFDLGDVLAKNSFEMVLAELAKNLKVDYQSIVQVNNEYKKQLMVGQISTEEVCQIMKDRLNLPLIAEEIYNAWCKSYKMVRVPNEELFDVVRKLKGHYIIGMISNIYDSTADIEKERGTFDMFDPCVLSCKVGLQKPDKEIFELALQKANLNANECIFIDNRESHLVEPQKMGFYTILFENNATTIEKMKKIIGDKLL